MPDLYSLAEALNLSHAEADLLAETFRAERERSHNEGAQRTVSVLKALSALNGSTRDVIGLVQKASGFDEAKHHRAADGKFGSGGGNGAAVSNRGAEPASGGAPASTVRADTGGTTGPHPADAKARSLLQRIGDVPRAVRERVKDFVSAKYKRLAERYGENAAKAILGACILLAPTPIPGSSLLPIALAEAASRIRRAVASQLGKALDMQLHPEDVEAEARDLLAELYEAMGEQIESPVAKAFDPNEKRDESGKWSESGGASSGASDGGKAQPDARDEMRQRYDSKARRLIAAARAGEPVKRGAIRDVESASIYLSPDALAEWKAASDELATASGQAPRKTVAVPESAAGVHALIKSGTGTLGEGAAKAHAEHAAAALARMPQTAHEAIAANLDGATVGTLNEIADAIVADHAEWWRSKSPGIYEVMEREARREPSAMYGTHSRKLYVPADFDPADYRVSGDPKEHRYRALAGLYAHELTHAIDGPQSAVSNSPEWREAFAAEIAHAKDAAPPLTKYAGTKPSEGLAEFGRLLYASDVPPGTVAAKFPKCAAVFKARGLWPADGAVAKAVSPVRLLPELFGEYVAVPGGHIDRLLASGEATDPPAQDDDDSASDTSSDPDGTDLYDDPDATNQALLALLIEEVGEAVENGDDPEAVAERFRALIDDPELLRHVADGTHTGTIGKALISVNDIRAGRDYDWHDPAPYGFCPECREPGIACERRPNGNAHCANGHAYPRTKAKYASTQIELTGAAKKKLRALAALIPDADLGEDGRETEPHVTARYGLHIDRPEPIAEVVAGFGPVRLTVGALKAFRGAESGKAYDVIYAEVDSPDLVRLNGELGALPHTDTHATYHPHATVAYVKAGLADKYLAELGAVNESCEVDELTYSTAKREQTVVSLGGERKAIRKAWDSSKHPRSKDGKFLSKDAMQEAKANPEKAAELRAKVKPEDAEKLEKVLSGDEDPGRTRRGQAKHEAQGRRLAKEESKARAHELISKVQRGVIDGEPVSAADLHALADHLPSMTVADLRRARLWLSANLKGDRKKEAMVERLRSHVRGVAAEKLNEATEGATVTSREEMRADDASPLPDTSHLDAAEGHAARMRSWEEDRPGSRAAEEARDRAEERLAGATAVSTGGEAPTIRVPDIASRAEYEAGMGKPKEGAKPSAKKQPATATVKYIDGTDPDPLAPPKHQDVTGDAVTFPETGDRPFVAHRDIGGKGWSVTDVRTGNSIGSGGSAKAAIAAAKKYVGQYADTIAGSKEDLPADVLARHGVTPAAPAATEAAPAPAAPAPLSTAPAPISLDDPAALARAVHAAGRELPSFAGHEFRPSGSAWDRHPVLIGTLYDHMQKTGALPADVTLDAFKAALFRAHQSDHLSLSRNDLPQVVPADQRHQIARGEIQHPYGGSGATLHKVDIPTTAEEPVTPANTAGTPAQPLSARSFAGRADDEAPTEEEFAAASRKPAPPVAPPPPPSVPPGAPPDGGAPKPSPRQVVDEYLSQSKVPVADLTAGNKFARGKIRRLAERSGHTEADIAAAISEAAGGAAVRTAAESEAEKQSRLGAENLARRQAERAAVAAREEAQRQARAKIEADALAADHATLTEHGLDPSKFDASYETGAVAQMFRQRHPEALRAAAGRERRADVRAALLARAERLDADPATDSLPVQIGPKKTVTRGEHKAWRATKGRTHLNLPAPEASWNGDAERAEGGHPLYRKGDTVTGVGVVTDHRRVYGRDEYLVRPFRAGEDTTNAAERAEADRRHASKVWGGFGVDDYKSST